VRDLCTDLVHSLGYIIVWSCLWNAMTRNLGRSISGARSFLTKAKSHQWSHASVRSIRRSWMSSGVLSSACTISAVDAMLRLDRVMWMVNLKLWHVCAVYMGNQGAWALAELFVPTIMCLVFLLSSWERCPFILTFVVWLATVTCLYILVKVNLSVQG